MVVGGIPIIDATQGSPAQISTSLFGSATGSMSDFGVDMTNEKAYKAGFEIATFKRDSSDISTWDMIGLPLSISLNKVGWYVATNHGIESGSPYPNLTDFVQIVGGVYDSGTLIDADQSTIRCGSSGGNWGEVWTGGCSVLGIRIKNIVEGKGDLYNFYAFRLQKKEATGLEQYSSIGSFHIWPAAIEDGLDFLNSDPDHDPNEDDPESTTGEDGGDGSHEPDYDPIPIPPLPDKGAATSGFLTMYKLGLVQINQFANDMFASDIWEAIRLFFSNPIDFLVGCMLLPFEPDAGSSYYPKFGVKKFAHAYPAVSNQYKTVDCGTIDVRKYWGSAFDFDPYTRLQIWLPYIGYRELPSDEIMDTTIGVVYHIDCLTGDCVAFVHRGVVGQTGPQIPRVIGQFYGNCGVRVPFGSVSFDAAIAAGVSLLTGAISTAGNITAGQIDQVSRGQEVNHEAALTRMATQLTASTINVIASTKPNIQKGGAAGASTGYMSIQKPYLIRRIPRQNLPDGYKDFHGYPANIRSTLGELGGGYAEIDDIQLNDIPAFENERREIIEWLKGGVLL